MAPMSYQGILCTRYIDFSSDLDIKYEMTFGQNCKLKEAQVVLLKENTLLTSSQIFDEQQNIIYFVVVTTSLLAYCHHCDNFMVLLHALSNQVIPTERSYRYALCH
jgi:hypothetical protein